MEKSTDFQVEETMLQTMAHQMAVEVDSFHWSAIVSSKVKE
jgi:hypothetical protein